MRVLLITDLYPEDPKRQVYGAHQRLDLLIEAVKGLGALDVLIYVHNGIDVSPAAVERQERILCDHWNTDISLFLAHALSRPWRLPAHKLLFLVGRSLAYGAFSYQGLEIGVKTSGRPQVRALRQCLERAPDVVIAQKTGAMAPLLLARQPKPPIILDMDDLEHVKLRRALARKPISRLPSFAVTYPLLVWGAFRAVRSATTTLLCSEQDRRRLPRWWGIDHVRILPNAVEPHSALPLSAEPNLLFLGQYYYPPNQEAADHLIAEIWPRVRAQIPEARLIVAGDYPEKIKAFAKAPDGVTFTGFVENLQDLYCRCRAVVVPILTGSGTRIKILEASVYGRPVVSTSVGAEGLDLVPGEDVLIQDDPIRFASACVRLLEDDTACEALASRARARVVERYARPAVVDRLRTQVRATVAGSRPSSAAGASSQVQTHRQIETDRVC